MPLNKINLEDVLKEVGLEPGAQEMSMVPTEHQPLFKELRRNNNMLSWLVRHVVDIHNIVADHDQTLTPAKIFGRMALGILGVAGGVIAMGSLIGHWIKNWLKGP